MNENSLPPNGTSEKKNLQILNDLTIYHKVIQNHKKKKISKFFYRLRSGMR